MKNIACLVHGRKSAESQQQDAALSKLIKDVDTYKDLLQKTETRLSKRIKELSGEVKTLTEQKESLTNKLRDFDDYDEIKRELEIMKYVEFSTGDDDRFDAGDVLNKDGKHHESLETRLMEKNKRLENDFTQLKVNFANLQQEFDTNRQSYRELVAKSEEQTGLIHRLEEDLLRMGQTGPSSGSSGGALVAELARTPSSANIANATGGHSTPRSPDYGSPRASYDASAPRDDKSILPIVMNQRDRFRQRNAELEEQTRDLETRMQDMQGEMDTLKADNLKLFERLRFVHVWKEEQSRGLTVSWISNAERVSMGPPVFSRS